MPRLTARSLKCTLVLDPNEIVAIPNIGAARTVLNVAVQDYGTVTADVASKSVRKVQNLVAEHGVDRVACIIQGKLVGGKITEAGLVAQVKAPKPVVQEAAA